MATDGVSCEASLLLPVWLVGVADDETEVGVSGEDVKVGGWEVWEVRAVGDTSKVR